MTIDVSGRNKEQRVRLAERRAAAMALLNQGMNYDQIATVIAKEFQRPKYTKSEAWRDCNEAVREITARPAREYVAGQLLDILRMKNAWRRKAREDAKAAAIMIRLLEREAKILGSDAPVRTKVEITAHFEALAQVAVATLMAGLDAIPDLTLEQRRAAVEAARASLELAHTAPTPTPQVIDVTPALTAG